MLRPYGAASRPSARALIDVIASAKVAIDVGGRPSTRRAESPRPMPQTVLLPNMSFKVANNDAVTVTSRETGFVTIGPTWSRDVASRIRE